MKTDTISHMGSDNNRQSGGTSAAQRRHQNSSSFDDIMQESDLVAKLKPSLRIRKGRWKLFLALCKAHNGISSNQGLNLLVEAAIANWCLPGYTKQPPPKQWKKAVKDAQASDEKEANGDG